MRRNRLRYTQCIPVPAGSFHQVSGEDTGFFQRVSIIKYGQAVVRGTPHVVLTGQGHVFRQGDEVIGCKVCHSRNADIVDGYLRICQCPYNSAGRPVDLQNGGEVAV